MPLDSANSRRVQRATDWNLCGKRGVMSCMRRLLFGQASLALGLGGVFVGCQTRQPKEQQPAVRTTVSTVESPPPRVASSAGDNCGLDEFPAAKPTREILAAVPRHVARRNNGMVAKVAIDPTGRVTHLRVLQLAWPDLQNSRAINEQAVESIKTRHYAPTIVSGKPVAVCSDVSVIVDLD